MDNRSVECFRRDGAVAIRSVFAPGWIELLSEAVMQVMKSPGPGAESLTAPGGEGAFFNDYCRWDELPGLRRFVFDSPAAELAARLMRSRRAVFYHEHILVKEPGALKETPWHHDQPYYPIDGDQNCSLWIPLDPVPLESSLRFIAGSHRWGRWFVPRRFKDSREYERSAPHAEEDRFETLDADALELDRREILAWSLEPGDCVAFHMRTLHSAPGNVSLERPRRVAATRWLGDDARYASRPWPISPPVTGGLAPGDDVACDTFPLVWQARSA